MFRYIILSTYFDVFRRTTTYEENRGSVLIVIFIITKGAVRTLACMIPRMESYIVTTHMFRLAPKESMQKVSFKSKLPFSSLVVWRSG